MRTSFVIVSLLLLSSELLGQRLISFKYTSCDEGNPQKYMMNTTINRIGYKGDSTIIDMTWIDNCEFNPELSLRKVLNDTIYFKYNNRDGNAACTCAFQIEIVLRKLPNRDYQIKFNDWPAIDKKALRYRSDGYIVEYFPERTPNRKKLREIFTENGKLLVEVFYDKNGMIVSEKFYDDYWGFLKREKVLEKKEN